jgi:hypothetical protein
MKLLYLYASQDARVARAVNKDALSTELQQHEVLLVRFELTTFGSVVHKVCKLVLLERVKAWICIDIRFGQGDSDLGRTSRRSGENKSDALPLS